MFRKNKLRKLISIGVISGTLIASGLTMLGIYASSLQTSYNFNQNTLKDPLQNSEVATLDSQIANVSAPSSYYALSANQYFKSLKLASLLSDYSNLLKNESIDDVINEIKSVNTSFSTSDLYKDILFFLKNIYTKSNKKISMALVKSDFSSSNNLVSFDYEVELTNTSSTTISFDINNTTFYLLGNASQKIVFKCDNQNYYFGVSKNYNNYYLNWKTNVTVEYDNKEYKFNDFSFTNNNYSIAIQTYISGLSDTNSYEAIKDTDAYFAGLTSDSLKNDIDTFLSNNMEFALGTLKYFSPIIASINQNTTLYNLLSNQKENISKLIIQMLGITETDQNYNSYLSLFSDLLASQDSLLTIIGNHGQALANLIALFVNDPVITGDVIYTYIKDINGNLSDQELKNQQDSLNGLISFFISSLGNSSNLNLDFITSLIGMVFNRNTTTLSLLSYMFNEGSNDLIDLLTTNDNLKTSYQLYFNLIGLLVKNPSQLVLGTLLSTQGREILSKIIVEMMGSNSVQGDTSNSLMMSLIQQIISPDNINLTSSSFSSLLTSLINPLLSFLSNDDNYVLTKNFNSFSFDKTNRQTSFDYTIQFEFKNSFSFDIKSLLDILPNSLKLGSVALPKTLLTYMLVQSGKALEMTIGVGDKIIFNFNADQEQIYLNPSLVNGSYVAGFNVPYHLTMRLDMPTLFSSITSFYTTGPLHTINNTIVDILEQFISQFLIRDYDFYGMISVNDPNTLLLDYDANIYYENNYFKWKQPSASFFTDLKNNISSVDSNSYSLKVNYSNILGTNSVQYTTVTGSKPVINSDFLQTIQSSIMEYNSDVAPIVKVTAEVNSNIPIKFIGVSLSSIEITLVKIQVWFPYGIIDITDPNNISFKNYFSVEINLS